MRKTSNFIFSILLIIVGLVLFSVGNMYAGLFFVASGLGTLLMSLGERVISRILMIIGFLGVTVYCVGSVIAIIMSLI